MIMSKYLLQCSRGCSSFILHTDTESNSKDMIKDTQLSAKQIVWPSKHTFKASKYYNIIKSIPNEYTSSDGYHAKSYKNVLPCLLETAKVAGDKVGIKSLYVHL